MIQQPRESMTEKQRTISMRCRNLCAFMILDEPQYHQNAIWWANIGSLISDYNQQMEPNQQPLSQQSHSSSQQLRHIEEGLTFAQIKPFWNNYFTTVPPLELNLALPLHKIIFAFKSATHKPYFSQIFQILDYDRQFYEVSLDYPTLSKKLKAHSHDQLAGALLEIFASFQYDAPAIIQSASLVVQAWLVECKRRSKKVCLVVQNYPQSDINDIKAHMIENFITFEAVVLKVYQIKLMSVSLEFDCPDCKATFTHYLTDGNYSQPSKCRGNTRKECKSRNFLLRKEKVKTIFMQRVKVQELDSEGRTPRQVMCELRENMVGKVITGQTVKLSGIIKTETTDEKDKKTQGIFVPYILVNSIVQKTNNLSEAYDHQLIKEMRSNHNLFYSLIKSFCPTIYGHQIVKAGLLLGILGGSGKNLSDESTFRQTSHVLLLGDPGIGKSQLLKFAVEILQHSIYVNATATSTSGLTVTVNRDNNNQQSLEAGALILADNGICAIDQFDKISDSSSLLEVMEQQTVSIAKAGVICQLKCRVGIVASANPTSGCYNKAKTFKDNTKISNAILSRFDLIFLLVDKPDPARDRKLAEHIMKIHNNKRKKKYHAEENIIKTQFNIDQYNQYLSLAEKYNKLCEMERESYSLDKLKKYFTFVKQEIHPTLSREACEVIKGFYMVLRDNCPNNSFQITNRHLQSMVRLAMARARIECRTEVTEEDAVEVTQLMQESLFDSFEQMGYNINSLKYEVKKAKVFKKNSELSLPKQRTLFIETLREKAGSKQSNLWEWTELVSIAKELQLNIGDFYSFIERLNQDGVLLQKGNKRYTFKDTFV